MHGVLPHSPLHVRSLADVEERVDQGHVYEMYALDCSPSEYLTFYFVYSIVKVRETRLTGIVSHILIGLSVFLIPYPLAYIPTAVLNGLFLYMAITSLNNNQMFERITLLFMEQVSHGTPIKKSMFIVNFLTGCIPSQSLHSPVSAAQDPFVHHLPDGTARVDVFLWLLAMAVHQDGLSCYRYTFVTIQVILKCWRIGFVTLVFFRYRHKIVPCVIDNKYLEALDGEKNHV